MGQRRDKAVMSIFSATMSKSQAIERTARPAKPLVWVGLLAGLAFAGFTGAAQAHPAVSPGSCNGCHNGGGATSKPVGHVVTSQSCDMCHTALSTLNFQSFAGGTLPTPPPVTPPPVTPPPVTPPPPVTKPPVTPPPVTPPPPVTKPPVTPPPAPTPTPPPSNGPRHGDGHSAGGDTEDSTMGGRLGDAEGSVAGRTGGANTGAGGVFVHPAVVTGCANCHNGGTAPGKPRDHIVTSLPCETCHTSTRTFAGARDRSGGIGAVTRPGAATGNGAAAGPGKGKQKN